MRSLLLSCIAVIAITAPSFAQVPEGFTPLFNGKDLTGWKATGKPNVWGAEDGVLYVAGGGGGWLITEKDYANFELRLEYKMPKMGNSGVAIRHAGIIADDAGNHEFIVHAVAIGCLDRSMRVGKARTLRIDKRRIGFGDALPALVAVHGVVAAEHGYDRHGLW